jgi:hypothetical protein
MTNRIAPPIALLGAFLIALLTGCAGAAPAQPAAVPPTAVPATAAPATATRQPPTAIPPTATAAATATAVPPTPVPTPTRAPTVIPATSVPTQTVGACAALPEAFMLATFGKPLEAPTENPDAQYGGTECQYASDDALVFVTFASGGRKMVQTMLDAAKGKGAPFKAAPGVGDEAWVATETVSATGVAGGAIVAVKDRVVSVIVLGGYTEAVTREKVLALGKVALGLK